MGANQSSKSRQQFSPDFNNPVATFKQPPSNTADKGSFGKQQLNRLLRRSLPTQSRLNSGAGTGNHHANINHNNNNNFNNKCKLNGNNKSDELEPRLSSGQQQHQLLQQPFQQAAKSPIYGHESRLDSSQGFVSDNNGHANRNPSASSGGSKFNYANDRKYFVSGQPQARQERLANNNNNHPQAEAPLSKTSVGLGAPSSYDANRGQPNRHHNANRNNLHEPPRATSGLFEHDHRLLLVRQQHQQHGNAAEQHHNKSIMTTSSPLSNHQQAQRQPLDSSNAYHYNHHHHPRQAQHQNQHDQAASLQQQLSTTSSIRPNKNSKPPQPKLPKGQQHMQLLKSSCSPSSASAASSSSPTTTTNSSGSSTAASSSESLKLQRQPEATSKRPLQAAKQQHQQPTSSSLGAARSKLNTSNEYPIGQGEQLVAMQQHHNRHRRTHSSGEPLSWSKQQQQAINLRSNNNNNEDHHQHQQFSSMLTNNLQQANQRGGQLQQQHHQDQQRANVMLDQHQMLLLSPNMYGHYQQLMDIYQSQSVQADELEQYYSRNLHLLTSCEQQEAFQTNQQQQQQQHLYTSNTWGHMSAPVQRRYKWPKQQYQYLNNSALLDGLQANQQHQQQQFQVHVPHQSMQHPSSQQLPNYDQHDLDSAAYVSMTVEALPGASLNHSAGYFDQDLTVSHLFPSQRAIHSSSSAQLKSGSKSLRKSPAVRGKSRSRNPLAGIFAPLASSDQKREPSSKFGANTIHHLTSSKSHQNLQSTISRSASQSNAQNVGSLKRIKSSPLTAQQTSYEAMRTIDMYLIRQIARSCQVSSVYARLDIHLSAMTRVCLQVCPLQGASFSSSILPLSQPVRSIQALILYRIERFSSHSFDRLSRVSIVVHSFAFCPFSRPSTFSRLLSKRR